MRDAFDGDTQVDETNDVVDVAIIRSFQGDPNGWCACDRNRNRVVGATQQGDPVITVVTRLRDAFDGDTQVDETNEVVDVAVIRLAADSQPG